MCYKPKKTQGQIKSCHRTHDMLFQSQKFRMVWCKSNPAEPAGAKFFVLIRKFIKAEGLN